MPTNFEKLKQFLNDKSTIQQEHVLWNEFEGQELTQIYVPKQIGLIRKQYRPYQLFWMLQNEHGDVESNINLSKTCEISNCISHYGEMQHNIKFVTEMNSFTYEQTCERFEKF